MSWRKFGTNSLLLAIATVALALLQWSLLMFKLALTDRLCSASIRSLKPMRGPRSFWAPYRLGRNTLFCNLAYHCFPTLCFCFSSRGVHQFARFYLF